ncbi:MAG: nuclear transport factor 2 family protein [Sandaracinaceae bacterium]|nr:nuclear transport factor 2 family protein [Myxococcales bacterium]MCB9660795.1 nuclear transport factor 2 family protein [Sandaracinaceae bacterium]
MPSLAVDVSAAPSEVLLVERFLAALESLDSEAILDLVADDVVYQNVPLPPARGRKQFEQQLGLMARHMTEFVVDSARYETRGATVQCNRYDTLAGPGWRMRLWVEGEFVVRNGLIVRWVDRFSWPKLLLATAKTTPRLLMHLTKRGR